MGDDTAQNAQSLTETATITVDDVRNARMRLTAAMDGRGFAMQVWACEAIPELRKVVTVARGKPDPRCAYGVGFVIAGRYPLPPLADKDATARAIVAAVNAVRSGRLPPGVPVPDALAPGGGPITVGEQDAMPTKSSRDLP